MYMGPPRAPPGMRGDGSAEGNYLGVMKEMDRQLGRIFAFIRSQPDLRENTVIILTSDNGPEPGYGITGGLRGCKANLYEGGIRSPLIVWSSRIPQSAVGSTNSTTILAGIDLLPSVLDMADVSLPDGVIPDGLNMSDVFMGRSSPKRGQPVMWVRPPDRHGPNNDWPDLAIRDGDWKLLINRDGSQPELFNILEDPREANNLAKTHPTKVKELGDKVIQWEKAVWATRANR